MKENFKRLLRVAAANHTSPFMKNILENAYEKSNEENWGINEFDTFTEKEQSYLKVRFNLNKGGQVKQTTSQIYVDRVQRLEDAEKDLTASDDALSENKIFKKNDFKKVLENAIQNTDNLALKALLQSARVQAHQKNWGLKKFDGFTLQEQNYLKLRFNLNRRGQVKTKSTRIYVDWDQLLQDAETKLIHTYKLDEMISQQPTHFGLDHNESTSDFTSTTPHIDPSHLTKDQIDWQKSTSSKHHTERPVTMLTSIADEQPQVQKEQNTINPTENKTTAHPKEDKKSDENENQKSKPNIKPWVIGIALSLTIATPIVLGPLAGLDMISLELALGIIASVTVAAAASIVIHAFVKKSENETSKVKIIQNGKSDMQSASSDQLIVNEIPLNHDELYCEAYAILTNVIDDDHDNIYNRLDDYPDLVKVHKIIVALEGIPKGDDFPHNDFQQLKDHYSEAFNALTSQGIETTESSVEQTSPKP